MSVIVAPPKPLADMTDNDRGLYYAHKAVMYAAGEDSAAFNAHERLKIRRDSGVKVSEKDYSLSLRLVEISRTRHAEMAVIRSALQVALA